MSNSYALAPSRQFHILCRFTLGMALLLIPGPGTKLREIAL